jgi:PadR family transcriptional regulator PadR
MTDVADISAGRVRPGAGTLYAALDRLIAEHLVEPAREEVVDGRLRRHYRLTRDGARVLAAEAERPRANSAAATRPLREAGRLAGGMA